MSIPNFFEGTAPLSSNHTAVKLKQSTQGTAVSVARELGAIAASGVARSVIAAVAAQSVLLNRDSVDFWTAPLNPMKFAEADAIGYRIYKSSTSNVLSTHGYH